MNQKHLIYNPEMECMDRQQRRQLQGERLRKTVKLEYDNVALYRRRMDEKGIKPEDIRSVDDLRYLPFMEKTDLRDEFPFGLLAAPKRDIVRIQGSSGTTGKPIVSGYTQNDVDVWTEMMARTLTGAGGTKDDIVQVCYGYGLFTGGLGAHQGATNIGAMVVPMSTATRCARCDDARAGVTLLCCTTYTRRIWAKRCTNRELTPRNQAARRLLRAEPWTEQHPYRSRTAGHATVRYLWLTESAAPGVSFECLKSSACHVNEDQVTAEIIDPVTGDPLPCGTQRLVFTTITKPVCRCCATDP
jgi:phenylacetate-CoA ligase